MQSITRWRTLLSVRNSLIPTLNSAATATVDHAFFHSTPASFDKWKSKSKSTPKPEERPPKNYIRYTSRQKRPDPKKALKDLLFHNGNLKHPSQDDTMWNFDGSKGKDSSEKQKCTRTSRGRGRKPPQKKTKRWHRQGTYTDEFDTEKIFEATVRNRERMWSFGDSHRFGGSSDSFEWKEGFCWTSGRGNEQDEFNDRISSVGSRLDRSTLDLPTTGPLKIEDVKTAFRTSALKWHPDKHQGPSQANAEEKFKLCVDAYKSLCSALA